MSPEQAMGERSVDHGTDIYALGAVTYEMLSGEPPFTGPTVQSIVAKLLADEPRALGSLRRSAPPNVEAAVMHSLEKLPADRMATAHEFAAALGADVAPPRVAAAGGRGSRRLTDPLVASLAALELPIPHRCSAYSPSSCARRVSTAAASTRSDAASQLPHV